MTRRGFLLAGGAAVSCARDNRPKLNVYNWSAYIDPATLPVFEREHHVRIQYGTYEGNEEMLAKIITGNSGWDVVFPTHSRLAPMARNHLLAPLDHARLPMLNNLHTRFRTPAWDPGLRYGIPYMWNATGIVYNRHQTAPPRGWDALWSPALKGRITMLDDPEDVIGVCLQKLGYPFDSVACRNSRPRKQKLSGKSASCAPTSMPRCGINWWRAMCWLRNSGPLLRPKPCARLRIWPSPTRTKDIRSTATARPFCRRAVVTNWPMLFSIFCCDRRLQRPMPVLPIPRQRTGRPGNCCPMTP